MTMLAMFVGQYFPVIATALISCFVVLLYYIISSARWHRNLPPGPYSYPVIGNILELRGKDMTEYIDECRSKYGDIFCLHFFHKRIIVFSGLEVLRDAFVKSGNMFTDRPAIAIGGNEGVVTSNGKQWKAARKFTLQSLREMGMGTNTLQINIHEEIRALLPEMAAYDGQPFDARVLLRCSIANVICSVVLGKRYMYNDSTFIEHLQLINDLAADPNTFIDWPLLQYIPGDPFGTRKHYVRFKEHEKFYFEIIDRRLEEYDSNNIKDVADAYIKQMQSNKPEETGVEFNRQQMYATLSDLVAAGSETTATALLWGMSYLMRNQRIQTKLYNELKENVPHDRLPNVTDKSNLPYTEATALEILRLGNVVPLAVPHATTQDCTFRGFHIPKDAFIMPNLQSVLYDNEIWDDPLTFCPERFIDHGGSLIQKQELIPFSIGRRACLGESLARMELFLFLSAMVQSFEFLPPEGDSRPAIDATLGITRMPEPFLVRAIPRERL